VALTRPQKRQHTADYWQRQVERIKWHAKHFSSILLKYLTNIVTVSNAPYGFSCNQTKITLEDLGEFMFPCPPILPLPSPTFPAHKVPHLEWNCERHLGSESDHAQGREAYFQGHRKATHETWPRVPNFCGIVLRQQMRIIELMQTGASGSDRRTERWGKGLFRIRTIN
jgi:hypothetical protein